MHAEAAYLFRHGLMRDAAYELQPPRDRALLHALVIDIAEALFGDDDDLLDNWAVELAEHAKSAQALRMTAKLERLKELARKEVLFLQRAADHSARNYDNKTASRVAQVLSQHPAATPLEQIRGLTVVGDVMLRTGNTRDATQSYERAWHIADLHDSTLSKARSARAIGICHSRLGEARLADEWIEKSLQLFRAANDRDGMGSALMSLALIRAPAAGPERTLSSYRKVLEYLDRPSGRAATWNNIGNVLRELRKFDEAEAAYQRAMDEHRKCNERHGEGSVLGNLTALYQERGQTEDALATNIAALDISRETGARRSEGISLQMCAILEQHAGHHETARLHYQDARDVFRDSGDRVWHGIVQLNLTSLLELTGEYEQAINEGEVARQLLRGVDNGYAIATCNVANAHCCLGNLQQARTLYEEGLHLLAELPWRSSEAIHKGGYAVVLKRLNEDEAAGNERASALKLMQEYGKPEDVERFESRWNGEP